MDTKMILLHLHIDISFETAFFANFFKRTASNLNNRNKYTIKHKSCSTL